MKTAEHPDRQKLPATETDLTGVLDAYVAALRRGERPSKEDLLRTHPEIASELSGCLNTLDVLEDCIDFNADPGSCATGLDSPDACATRRGECSARTLGDFCIHREIGRGGMGVVYEAEQISLGRRVALKVLPFASMLDERQLQRFKNEARAAATLNHPNIVPVYFVGCERGVHFYAMQYIEGQTLAAVIDALRGDSRGSVSPRRDPESRRDSATCLPDLNPEPGTLTPSLADTAAINALSTLRTTKPRDFYRRIAELGIQAAEALDHAHQLGIVHRDIKPANLLIECSHLAQGSHLAPRDGTLLNLKPRTQNPLTTDHRPLTTPKLFITDFGLARLPADAGMTMTGDLVGTLRYMSPEQALAKRITVDHRTDIYSLGVTLYEPLALQPAFNGADREEVLRQIAFEEPTPLRRLRPANPVELETIIHKSISKNPDDRYATARELSDDLARFCCDQPIRAKPPTALQRAVRWSWRHRGLVVGGTVLLAVAAVLATIAVFLLAIERDQTIAALHEVNSQRQRAVAAQDRAETGLELARTAVDDMYTRVASVWLSSETAPSAIQIDLMRRALAAYEQLAALPLIDAASRRSAAIAFERVGEIKHFLGQKREAAEAIQTSIDLLNVNEDADAPRKETLATLVARHRKLAQVQLALARWNNAEESYAAGSAYVESLLDRDDPRLEHRFELALFRMLGAELAIQSGSLEEAEMLASAATEELTAIIEIQHGGKHHRDVPLDWQVTRTRAELLLSDVMRRLGRLMEAEKLGNEVLASINRGQWSPFYDARELVQLEAEAHDQLASVKIALGEPQAAIVHLRDSLRLKQQNLRAKQRPFLFWHEGFLGKRGLDEANEPVPFCSYAETQLRLGILLQSVGRPYEAERLIGEAIFTGSMLCDAEPGADFRYMLLHANALSAAADWADTSDSEDAERLRVAADTVWRAIATYFPQASEYAGLPGEVRDRIQWWRKHGAAHLPQEKLDVYRNVPARKTTFYQHVIWPTVNSPAAWDSGDGGKIRAGGRVDDCFHIAIAHHRRGNKDEARVWLDYAIKTMGDKPHIELAELREEAEALQSSQSKTEEPKD